VRRLLPLIAALALIGLAGCGEERSQGELLMWHAYSGSEQEGLIEAVQRYNAAHPDLPINPQFIPYGSYSSKLRSAIPRDNGPDLFIYPAHEPIGGWVEAGLLAPVDLPDGYLPRAAEAVRYQDQDWGLPVACKVAALFYNPELVHTPPQTRDEMVTLARQLTDDPVYGLAYEVTDFFYSAAWFLGAGGDFFDDDGAITLDTPAMAEMLRFARALVMEEHVAPEEASGVLVAQLFNDGHAAMVISGPWFLSQLDDDTPRGVAPLPVPARPLMGVETMYVSSFARHPDAAMTAARELSSPAYDELRVSVGKQVLARPHDYEDPVLAAFAQGLDRGTPIPNRPQMSFIWEPAASALRKVMRGAATPEEGAEFAQRRAEILNRPLPERANPVPLMVIAGLLCLAGAWWATRKVQQQDILRRVKESRTAYYYLAPAVLAMLALVVLPFVTGSGLSLFSHRAGEYSFVGLSNFISILFARDYSITDPLSFWFTLGVTVLWTVLNVALHVSIGMALALLLRDPWMRMRGIYRVLLIIPWAVPNYITALIWKGMFNKQFGAINAILEGIGLQEVSWFSNFWTALAANVCTNTWLGFPFMMVVTLGALQAVPRDLEEAAEVDGANRWQRFRHVTLPLLKPALLPAVILGSVWTFNMFNIVYLVSAGEPDGGTEILISEAYRWAFTREAQYGYAAAYAVLIFVVLLGFAKLTDRLTSRGKGA
jgi:arabinogalactan oligomer / maltooligosaccharide transport system permease protein